MGEKTAYAYDGAGNLIEKTDAKGQRTVYGYDETGRLATIRYFTGPHEREPVKTVTFTYDEAGNLTAYDDGKTSGRYTRDALHRKTGETVDYGPFSKTMAYTYDGNGLKTSYTDPEGVSYTYTHDEANRLTGIEAPGLGTIAYQGYQWKRPTRITLPGSTRRNLAYDPLMRARRITSRGPEGRVILDEQYTYDRMDNITNKATEHGEYRYTYDPLDRLTEAGNPTLPDEAFTYDPVGNRIAAKGVAGSWSYNANNELVRYDGVTLRYDANGNTVERVTPSGVSRYGYNEEDRMVRVEDEVGNLVATYAYDPFGRRLWKEIAGNRVYFLYSDEGLIAEYDDQGNKIRAYGYTPGSTWTTDPVFTEKGGEYFIYHNDHLGTPRKITATDGDIVWSAKASSFGKAKVEVERVCNHLRFPGQYWDAETKLHYNTHRYYAPALGKYLVIDPIGFAGGINLYSYVEANPNRFSDPLGLIDTSWKNFKKDPRICNNQKFSHLPMETRIAIYEAWVKEKEEQHKPQIMDIFRPTDFTKTDGCSIECDWERLSQCVILTVDSHQISACQSVCQYATHGPPGYPKIASIGLCGLCITAKGYDVYRCFTENCHKTECCK